MHPTETLIGNACAFRLPSDYLPAVNPKHIQTDWHKDKLLDQSLKWKIATRIHVPGPFSPDDEIWELVTWLNKMTVVIERGN